MHLRLIISTRAQTGDAHTCVCGRTVRMCCTRVSILFVLEEVNCDELLGQT